MSDESMNEGEDMRRATLQDDPLLVVHTPVTAKQRMIFNSFGVVIGGASSPREAEALVKLINAGAEALKTSRA